MLESLLHHKKEEKEYICALVVSTDRIDAALWETTKDGKVAVLKTSEQTYTGDWDEAINAADAAVTVIESALPPGSHLRKVVFGLYPEWLAEDHIKEHYLKQLKQLTVALSLTPIGFVEMPLAITHLLQKDEGTAQTVILIGFEKGYVTVSLFKIGKLVSNQTLPRSETMTHDLEKALATFADIEVLPSRILLYGSDPHLETIKSDLLNYPWQKKANFLHFPKIETLPMDFPAKAVAIASASEITGEIVPETAPIAEENLTAALTPAQTIAEDGTEMESIAEDLGFTATEEEVNPPLTDLNAVKQAEVQNVVPPVAPLASIPKEPVINGGNFGKKFQLPTLPKFEFSFRIPRAPKAGLIVGIIAILLLVLAGTAAATWYMPQATVKLLVKPQTLSKVEQITVDPEAVQANVEEKILPGKILTTDISGNDSVATTGKKTVGEKAKGEVTIYNKTLNTKAFKKGAVLQSGKLKFTLDADVSVASASEGLGTLTYGTIKTNVIAGDIGTDSNLGPATDFTFTELPSSSYSARNEKALSGGSSKDVQVVARDDQKQLREKTLDKLKEQVTSELQQQLGSSEKLLSESITTDVTKEIFSKEIGEESDTLSLDMTMTAQVFTYDETDFFALLDEIMSSSVPSNFEFKREDVKLTIDSVTDGEGEAKVFTTHLETKLLPKIETDLTKQLTGKSIKDATSFLSSQQAVAGVEFDVRSPFPWMKNKLPLNTSKIHIEVATL